MCRMRQMLEERKAEYITGSAMMEPSVRIKTNEQGFCFRHFDMMVRLGKRLSNALILESHLQLIEEELIFDEDEMYDLNQIDIGDYDF